MSKEFFEGYGKGSPNVQFVIDPTMPPYPEDYLFNGMILEIANNFPFVRWLMFRHQEGHLREVKGILENDWFKFLLQKNIKVLDYENNEEERFIKENYKIPVEEKK